MGRVEKLQQTDGGMRGFVRPSNGHMMCAAVVGAAEMGDGRRCVQQSGKPVSKPATCWGIINALWEGLASVADFRSDCCAVL